MSPREASAAAASEQGSGDPGSSPGSGAGSRARRASAGRSSPPPRRPASRCPHPPPPPPLPELLFLRLLPGRRCRRLGRAAAAAAAASPERASERARGREEGGGGGGAGGARAGAGAAGRGIYKVKPHCQTCSSDCSSCCRCAAPEPRRAGRGRLRCSRGARGGGRGLRLTLLCPAACHLRGAPQPSFRATRFKKRKKKKARSPILPFPGSASAPPPSSQGAPSWEAERLRSPFAAAASRSIAI